jgi:2-dehydropantoate 2-reductase
MNILLIGAGAVGQVYGYHYQQGGADVAFFVREKYAEETRKGFDLYNLNRRGGWKAPVHFEGFDVLTDMAEVGNRRWDIVVLCLSSTALRSGTWFEELAAGLGDATLVNLTPGIEDYQLIAERVPEEQIVSGVIGLSSYPGPLPGDKIPSPGMVYWVPPLTKMVFSGPSKRAHAAADTLGDGGMPSAVIDDVTPRGAFGGPVLQFLMVALELADWSFKKLRGQRALMALNHRATREAFVVAAARTGLKVPFGMRLIRPWILRLLTRFTRFVVPFDIALFFKKHFSKVGDQTELGMTTLIGLAESQGNPASAMKELLQALVEARSEAVQMDTMEAA